MKVDEEVKNVWKERLRSIPKKYLAAELGLTVPTIYNALKGNCNQSTIDKINAWLLKNKDREYLKINLLK